MWGADNVEHAPFSLREKGGMREILILISPHPTLSLWRGLFH